MNIVLIGRPNVGKSTLFNCLIARRQALVHDRPGVTRDRLEAKTVWEEKGRRLSVTLIDTGGIGHSVFADEIQRQVSIALKTADAILFVVDAKTGLHPVDREIFVELKQSGLLQGDRKTPIHLVINKVDTDGHEPNGLDFYSFGIESVFTVSGAHGRGIDDLKHRLIEDLEAFGNQGCVEESPIPESPPKIAVVGRPNVGKSTFVNALLSEERMITSPIAGTTVDAVDSPVCLNEKPYILLDTAGIRRKSKTEQGIEVLSVVLAKKAMDRSNVAVLLLDGKEGITDQDEKIGSLIEAAGCSVVLAVNKWDTQSKGFTKDQAAELIRKKMAFLRYAPLLFVSAKNNSGFENLGSLIEEILSQRAQKLGTHELTDFLRAESTVHNPKNAKIYFCHQVSRNPPTVACHVNDPRKLPFNLRGHLVNAMRQKWGFMGTPLRLLFKKGRGSSTR